MTKFYPCLFCHTTDKSIQTFFCNSCEEMYIPEVKRRKINITLHEEIHKIAKATRQSTRRVEEILKEEK